MDKEKRDLLFFNILALQINILFFVFITCIPNIVKEVINPLGGFNPEFGGENSKQKTNNTHKF